MFSGKYLDGMLTMIVVISAICGWAAIEFILWLFSFISISIN